MDIPKRRWGWRGHTLRKPNSHITRRVLTWNTQGKRKMGGGDRNTWRHDLEADIMQTGFRYNNWRGLLRTGDVGEKLCMAYAPGGATGLSKGRTITVHDHEDKIRLPAVRRGAVRSRI